MNNRNTDMLSGPLFPSIIRYTIPVILTSILQLLFNAADLVIVGQFCGSISVAAVGATGSITALLVNFFMGLSIGASVSVAYGIGRQNDEYVYKTIHTALPTAIVSGLALTIIGITFSDTFLHMTGTPDNVLKLSSVYMKIYFGGVTFSLVYNYCASILRAVGDTRSPLIFLSIAGVTNVGLNVIFVTLFHMNVAGVALATALSNALSAVLVIRALMRRTDACKLHIKELRFHKDQFVEMMRIGLPAGMQSSLFAISNVLIQSSVNSFGDIFMSGSAAAGNIEGFVYVAVYGFSQTAVNFVSQNAGAGQYNRIPSIMKICFSCVIIVGLTFGGIVRLLGPNLLSIYITDSPEAISYGILRLSYVCIMYFTCGLMDVSTGALRGLGQSFVPMLISVLGVCGFRIAWIYTIFRVVHTPECLFISYPISWIITFLFQLTAFIVVYKRVSQENPMV